MSSPFKAAHKALRHLRWRPVVEQLGDDVKTVLDVGGKDLFLFQRLRERGYEATVADLEPQHPDVERQDIEGLTYADGAFDAVVCLEVLEHVPDPIRAMRELARVARKRLIITVPNEPWFTFWRFLNWEREHLWAIRPEVFRLHLGEPEFERTLVLGRYYLAAWDRRASD
jgi:SAM-dependent methyltransferase